MAVAAGCSATITPPVSPPRPTAVYLCDYGYHSSLLLPVGHGAFVEYLYGDWDWAALNQTGVWPAVRAALFSSRAALGRRYVYVGDEPVRPMTVPATFTRLVVDGAKADRLQRSLDARWSAHADTAVYTGAAGAYYVYVQDEQSYGLLHNCNRVTADWLEATGCRADGLAVTSHFDLGR